VKEVFQDSVWLGEETKSGLRRFVSVMGNMGILSLSPPLVLCPRLDCSGGDNVLTNQH